VPAPTGLPSPSESRSTKAVENTTPPGATTPDIERLTSTLILQLTPCLEQMGPTLYARKELWWEREWRRIGDLRFSTNDIVMVFAPEHEHVAFGERLSRTTSTGTEHGHASAGRRAMGA
jgi:hypothetical protein